MAITSYFGNLVNSLIHNCKERMSESNHSGSDSIPHTGLEFKHSLENSGFGHRSDDLPFGEGSLGESISSLGDSSSLTESVSLLGKTEQEIFELKNIVIRNKDKVCPEF